MSDLVERLRKREQHHYCEDGWYSCPMHPEGCADERQTECNCGAGRLNDLHTDAADEITRLRAELQQAQDRLKLADRIISITTPYADRNWTLLREWRAGK